MDLLISLIAGAIGGNIAGGLVRTLNLGFLVNSLAGTLGGAMGGQALGLMALGGLAQTAPHDAALDPTALAIELAAGGLGGAACLLVAGLLRNLVAR
ncbi:hypothetical protein ACSQ76_20825 [Roseovarius sp. B08]|uniref:hypothetical protein n=1 Tax=Roseovarius sp. B08 TaxID=3449223 RepID=UPI003EDC1D15